MTTRAAIGGKAAHARAPVEGRRKTIAGSPVATAAAAAQGRLDARRAATRVESLTTTAGKTSGQDAVPRNRIATTAGRQGMSGVGLKPVAAAQEMQSAIAAAAAAASAPRVAAAAQWTGPRTAGTMTGIDWPRQAQAAGMAGGTRTLRQATGARRGGRRDPRAVSAALTAAGLRAGRLPLAQAARGQTCTVQGQGRRWKMGRRCRHSLACQGPRRRREGTPPAYPLARGCMRLLLDSRLQPLPPPPSPRVAWTSPPLVGTRTLRRRRRRTRRQRRRGCCRSRSGGARRLWPSTGQPHRRLRSCTAAGSVPGRRLQAQLTAALLCLLRLLSAPRSQGPPRRRGLPLPLVRR
jgi:hypothetical protein